MTGPPAAFGTVPLETVKFPAGTVLNRIYPNSFLDPLGFGKTSSRFSDPRTTLPESGRFGVLYLGTTLKVCFLEGFLRDQKNGTVGALPIRERELHSRDCARIRVETDLTFVDLRDEGPVKMGVPSGVTREADHAVGQAWSLAFHEHPSAVDGIAYRSRLNNEPIVAIYGRAVPKLAFVDSVQLIAAPGIAALLNDLRIALIRL